MEESIKKSSDVSNLATQMANKNKNVLKINEEGGKGGSPSPFSTYWQIVNKIEFYISNIFVIIKVKMSARVAL